MHKKVTMQQRLQKNRTHILLVEDSPSDAELALLLFKRSLPKVRVQHAHDGVEAIDFLGKARSLPRLILLDLKMPRADGFQVLRTIRQHRRTKNIPVVIFSSSDDDQDKQRCENLGATSYVVKPMNFPAYRSVLLDSCKEWLGSPGISQAVHD